MMTTGGLEPTGEQKDLGVTENPACEMQRGRQSVVKSAWNANNRVTGPVCNQLLTSNEEVETGHRIIHLLHNTGAISVRLDELDGRSKVCASDLDWPCALFGPMFHLREEAAARGVVEKGGGFGITDEIDRGNRNARQIEWRHIHPQCANNSKRLLVVRTCGPLEVIA